MSARSTLRRLTRPAQLVYVLIVLLTLLAQIIRWTFAFAAEVGEGLVQAGQSARDRIAGASDPVEPAVADEPRMRGVA